MPIRYLLEKIKKKSNMKINILIGTVELITPYVKNYLGRIPTTDANV